MKDCIWKLGDNCNGSIKVINILNRGAFAVGLHVPVCEAHIKQHNDMLDLYVRGHSIVDILNMSEEKRKEILSSQSDSDD